MLDGVVGIGGLVGGVVDRGVVQRGGTDWKNDLVCLKVPIIAGSPIVVVSPLRFWLAEVSEAVVTSPPPDVDVGGGVL